MYNIKPTWYIYRKIEELKIFKVKIVSFIQGTKVNWSPILNFIIYCDLTLVRKAFL